MKVFLFIALISVTSASNQKVVTGFNCESSSSSTREWQETKYGPNGGTNGGFGSFEGRLFEFDCQTGSCRDSEGENGHWWVTCGYSWKNVDDLSDSDQVIVDVKTEASNDLGSCNDNKYTRALDIDSTGRKARDSQGDRGHWGFWFCYRSESWETVKSSGLDIVTELMAKTSKSASGFTRIGQWDTHNGGLAKAYGDNKQTKNWMYIFTKKELPSDPCASTSCDSPPLCHDTTTCSNGDCVYPFSAAGTPCDDGNDSTIDDVCDGFGGCAGSDPCASVGCNSPPLCHDATTCSNGDCVYPFSVAGTQCDDGNDNTIDDICDGSGGCAGTDPCASVSCNSPPLCHDTTTCSNGDCVYPFSNAGTPCDDGNDSTIDDVCDGSGGCAGTDPCASVSCNSPPLCHDATTCANGDCVYPFSAVGTPCDDGNDNTFDDVCDGSGGCAGSDPCASVSCNSPPICHDATTCSNGDCVYPFSAAGTPCDDGNDSTIDDACDGSGGCAGIVDNTVYFWDNAWPSDTVGGLDGTVLFAQSQIFPSKHGIAGDSQPHLTAKRKALVMFQPHVFLSGDVSIAVRDASGNILSSTTMNDPEDLPKHVGWVDIENVPQFPSSLETPYIIQHQQNINLVNDETAVFLASKFSDENNNEVEVKFWDGSWTRNLYLPNGNDVPANSKVQITCNSGWTVNINYPNTVTGGWRRKIVSRGDVLILVLTDERIWIAESDLEYNAYLFGRNFYSTTLDAEWVDQGMTLEFQHGNQIGTLDDIKIGAVTEVLIATLDVGFLISPRDEFAFAKDPTAHREYFETIPATRLIVAEYEPLHLTEVMLPTGKLYQTVSDDNGGWHSGDMRQHTGKILLSHGIDLANYGIHSSTAFSESPHPFTCAQMTAHNTRGVYQNGVIVHGGSGGNGMVTLDSSIGNEFSHELGHNYGLGHYVGGFDGSVHRPANEIDSSWQWDSELNLFTPNFASKDRGNDQCVNGQCEPAFMGKYQYGKDSMAGGSPQWGANRFTFYTPFVEKRIQDNLESKAIWDPTSSTGFRKYDPSTKKMEEFANADNGHKVPQLYRVPVTTIVGYYDPDATRRLSSYIFPAMYGAYGFVYNDDESVSGEKCSLLVETANSGTLVFELSTNINSRGMNKFHVNVATDSGAHTAKIFCQNELLDTRFLEAPQNPDLTYTVNGIAFDDEIDNSRRALAFSQAEIKLGNGPRLLKARKI